MGVLDTIAAVLLTGLVILFVLLLWLLKLAVLLALLGAAVYVVVWVLQYMGVLTVLIAAGVL